MDEKQSIRKGDMVSVAAHDLHISLYGGAVHNPGKVMQHHGYKAVEVLDVFDDGMIEVKVGKSGDVDNVPLSACTLIESLDAVMTVAEVAAEYELNERGIRDTITRGQLPARQSGSTWLIRRADAEARWGDKRQTKRVRHEDGSATQYTRNVQNGKTYYYAQELYPDGLNGQGDIYDVTEDDWNAANPA